MHTSLRVARHNRDLTVIRVCRIKPVTSEEEGLEQTVWLYAGMIVKETFI